MKESSEKSRLYQPEQVARIRRRAERWARTVRRSAQRRPSFDTGSGIPLAGVYTPGDVENADYLADQGLPGEYPFTRGVHPTGYRSRLWTIRMFSGFGTAEETNARFKYLLAHGETGLSVAFDMPTLLGYDTDDPNAVGEFGKCGVAISSLADMELLFKGIDLSHVTTSMTINGPAAVVWAMYIAAAEKQGVAIDKLGGTIQNDVLKEYISQNSYIFPPGPSLRLVVDTFEYGTKHLPLWNTISISGYHIREAGATAAQELAFTLADGMAYVQAGIDRGLDVDEFAPRLSFFFNVHNDLLEEVAKFRAARRIWARQMKQRFGAKQDRSLWMRCHAQTSGCTLTAQQPMNNVVRTTIQALAAVLGGVQSLHTNSLDEALALPSEQAVELALRTQQIIASESGVANTVDPLGGSYVIEWLTNKLEGEAYRYFERIDALGGVIPAIENGFFQREIADAAYRYQKQIDDKDRTVVGINAHVSGKPATVPILHIDEAGQRRHLARLAKVRQERDRSAVRRSLNALRQAARGQDNLMPYIMEAVRAYATLGEVCGILRQVFGEYKSPVAA